LKILGKNLHLDQYELIYFALCSGIAGAIAAFLSNIMDVIKTRWQVQSHTAHTSIWSLIKEMWQEDEWRTFLQGAEARVLWAIPNVVISFTFYEILKRKD
jgi:hypothetical protein